MKKLLFLLPFVLGSSMAFNSGVNSLTAEVPFSQGNGFGPVQLNLSTAKNPLTAGGVVYPLGFGTNANSKLNFKLDGKCTNFTAKISMDSDTTVAGAPATNGVIYKVFVNGVRKYKKFMDPTTPTQTISLDLTNAKTLYLFVDNNGDSTSDHADWLAPTITCNSDGGTLTTVAPVVAPPGTVVVPTPTSIAFSTPLVITQGGTYSGNYKSTDNSPVITVNTTQPVVIQNSVLVGGGDIIVAGQGGANITVRNVKSFGVNPNVIDKFNGGFINVYQIKNLIAENNYYEGTNGIIVNQYTGDNTANNVIRIRANYGKNITGMYSDGNNGWKSGIADVYATHDVILDKVVAKNVDISYNRFENEVGKSAVSDIINMYRSSGYVDSPINIHDNFLKGAYNYTPLTNVAYYGGGILLQDGTSSGELNGGGGFVTAQNNTVINTTNYGMQTQDGHDTKMLNNRVFETGKFDDGTRKPFVNTGIVDYRANKGTSTQTEEFLNHYVQNNYIQWVKFNVDGTPALNGYYAQYTPYYDAFPAIRTTNFSNNTVNDTVYPAANIPAEYTAFTSKVSTASLSVGPTCANGTPDVTTLTAYCATATAPATSTVVYAATSNPTPTPSIPADVVWSGPTVITVGGVYTGNWFSNDPNVAAVTVTTSDPVTIINSNMKGKGHLIYSGQYGNQLTVKNSRGWGLNPNVARATVGRFVDAQYSKSVDIENNYFQNTSGIYIAAFYYNDTDAKASSYRVLYNKALNIDGRLSDGNNGWLQGVNDFERVQFTLINTAIAIGNAEIAWNSMENRVNESRVEDNINMYETSGYAGKPILIHDNLVNGAFPLNPDVPGSYAYSGGGIISDGNIRTLTDATGGQRVGTNLITCAYIVMDRNIVLNTSNYGVSINNSQNVTDSNNRVTGTGRLPGTTIRNQFVNTSYIDWTPGETIATAFGHSFINNYSNWTKYDTTNNPILNQYYVALYTPYYDALSAADRALVNYGYTIQFAIAATDADVQAELNLYQSRVTAANVKIGPQPY